MADLYKYSDLSSFGNLTWKELVEHVANDYMDCVMRPYGINWTTGGLFYSFIGYCDDYLDFANNSDIASSIYADFIEVEVDSELAEDIGYASRCVYDGWKVIEDYCDHD